MSQQHLAAASDSELGTELRQEARSSGSYFSLLHRDLLNNVRLITHAYTTHICWNPPLAIQH